MLRACDNCKLQAIIIIVVYARHLAIKIFFFVVKFAVTLHCTAVPLLFSLELIFNLKLLRHGV